MLLERKIVAPPERNEIVFIAPIQDGLTQVCVVVTLCNTLVRWQSPRKRNIFSDIREMVLCVLGIAVAATMLLGTFVMEYLIHRALHGVELVQKPQFRRIDQYIHLRAQGCAPIWYGIDALAFFFAPVSS